MELDNDILNACRVIPLDIILHDSIKYPQNLPVYIEVVISEGRIPSEYIAQVADFPRYREASIRGYKKLWNSFFFDETEKSIIIDITCRDTFKGDKEDLRTSIHTMLRYKDKTVVLSKRACDCLLDLYWLENRDDCRLYRNRVDNTSNSDSSSDRSDRSEIGEENENIEPIAHVQSLASGDQIPEDQEGDDV